MSVQDVIKNQYWNPVYSINSMFRECLRHLPCFLLLGGVIYLVYRKFYVGSDFFRSFAITLVGMTVLTCMVTLAISTEYCDFLAWLVHYLLYVFRTAVKDSMDLLYLFWAITTGIIAGAGMYVLAVLVAVIMIVMIYLFYHRQQNGKIYIVVIHYTGDDAGDEIIRNFGKNSLFYQIKDDAERKRQRWQLKYSADRIRWTLRKKSVRLKMWMM